MAIIACFKMHILILYLKNNYYFPDPITINKTSADVSVIYNFLFPRTMKKIYKIKINIFKEKNLEKKKEKERNNLLFLFNYFV